MIRKATLAAAALLALTLGCTEKQQDEHHHSHADHNHEHETAHGGSLNALGICENGHAEVKVTDSVLTLWFVGGCGHTDTAVRIPDAEINLAVTLDGEKEHRVLVLKAKPDQLAEETEGDCSRFEGSAEWLRDAKKFVATGRVTLKGRTQDVRIEFPEGYDPD